MTGSEGLIPFPLPEASLVFFSLAPLRPTGCLRHRLNVVVRIAFSTCREEPTLRCVCWVGWVGGGGSVQEACKDPPAQDYRRLG
jgi:hypothetical protein